MDETTSISNISSSFPTYLFFHAHIFQTTNSIFFKKIYRKITIKDHISLFLSFL